MNTWFPDLKAFWAAENIVATIHNIYTLRGALVRDALEWSRQINKALYLFGQDADVMFASHSWPRWGNDRDPGGHAHPTRHLRAPEQRRAAPGQPGRHHQPDPQRYRVPESLQQQWTARSYHGSVDHNAALSINRYLGYWDGNPTTLIPLSPEDSAPAVRRADGWRRPDPREGTEGLAGSRRLPAGHRDPRTSWSTPSPDNTAGQGSCSPTRSSSSATSRRARACGTASLRRLSSSAPGIPQGAAPKTCGPDMIRALSTGQFLDFLGIRLRHGGRRRERRSPSTWSPPTPARPSSWN